MIGLICMEGLGPQSSYPDSYIRHLARCWKGNNWGPVEVVDNDQCPSIELKANKAWEHCHSFAQNHPDLRGLVVAGYSQGGGAGVLLSNWLQQKGWSIDLLVLFDAISRDPGGLGVSFDPKIGANVSYTLHAWRAFATNSRPTWGNCGRSAPSGYMNKTFWVTHWGAGGVDACTASQPVGPPNDLVWEDLYPTGKMHPTAVTYGDDWAGSHAVWNWIWPNVRALVEFFENRTPARNPLQSPAPPVQGQPVGTNPPSVGPGNGNGGGKGGDKYTVVSGDSLSLISGRKYGDVLLWPVIYDANKPVIGGNPNLIKPGQNLTIPSIAGYSQGQLTAIRSRGRNA